MKLLLSMLAGLVAVAATAQDFKGIAVYQSKSKMTITTNGDGPPMDEALLEQLNKLSEKTFTLVFNKTESVYEEEVRLESPSMSVGDMSFNFGGSKLYKNLKEKTFSREMDMMGKEFLVQDSLQKYDWVLVNETKQIK
jgi:GLPGLI family protein